MTKLEEKLLPRDGALARGTVYDDDVVVVTKSDGIRTNLG